MPNITQLKPHASWVKVTSTQEDWDAITESELVTITSQLQMIRSFEEAVLELSNNKLMNGPAHTSIGQEACAVGAMLRLRPTDQIDGSHRGHHQFLAKAFNYVSASGLDLRQPVSAEIRDVLYRTMSEISGLAAGYCKGRGGSMHLQWKDIGAMGTNALVGGQTPIAGGLALAHKYAGEGDVAVCFIGDGAANTASALETMNMAAAWKLPVCFFIENNHFAVSTTDDEATGEKLSGRGVGFGIPSWLVDGMDAVAVDYVMKEALEIMRNGGGPTLIEADTYRHFHHNGPFPGSAFGYRTKEEEQAYLDRDALAQAQANAIRRGVLSEDDVAAIRKQSKDVMNSILDEILEEDPEGRAGARRIRPELWPDPDFVDVGIRGDESGLEGATFKEADDFAEDELVEKKFVDVMADVMYRRMETDDTIFTLGEDIHKLSGGSRGATRGLADEFPERVIGTPISENGFIGIAGGAALDGRYRPVAELMYADFLWVAADQLFNQIGKARHMFGGDHPMGMVCRMKIGINTGYGSQHSMDPAGQFVTCPGWRIIAPSTALDYIGMMNTALKLDDPVAVLEHDADLYKAMQKVPANDLDFCIPVGKAAKRREGDEMTVISYLSMVHRCVEAADEAEVDADVIDLRWLDKASIDWEMIEESVKRTNRVLLVEQGNEGTSYFGWMADEIQRRLFDWLDAPIMRVHGSESAPTISKVLEYASLAHTEDIVAAMQELQSM